MNKNEITNSIIVSALKTCDTEHIEMIVEKLFDACSDNFKIQFSFKHNIFAGNEPMTGNDLKVLKSTVKRLISKNPTSLKK